MPTTRPRFVLTETEQLARMLDDAAQRWPADRDDRARLLRRLVAEGHRAVADDRAERVRRGREALRRTSGALTGLYPPGYLEELRADWPQ